MGFIVAIVVIAGFFMVRGVLRDRDRFGGRGGSYKGRRDNTADHFFSAGASPLLWTDDNKDNHGHHGHGHHGHHGHHDSGWGGGHGDHGGGWGGGDGGHGGGDCGGGDGGGGGGGD